MSGLVHILRLAGVGERYADRRVEGSATDLDEVHAVGTVHKRKDGEWIKTAEGWVRVTKKLKAGMGASGPSPAAAPPSKASASPKATPTAKAQAVLQKTTPASTLAPAAPKPAAGPMTPEQRAQAAEEIMPTVNRAMKALGDSYDKAEFSGRHIQASFRTWSLPKDPPSDPSDWDDDDDGYNDSGDYYDYEEKVSKVLNNAHALLKKNLADVADKVDDVSVEMGDKNYVEVTIRLK